MTEQLHLNGDRAYIALVTTVPAAITALTAKALDNGKFDFRGATNPRDLNHRFMSKIRLSKADPIKDILPDGSNHVVDLFFLPTVTDRFDVRSGSNIDDLASQLEGYDLAVDLCELTALYRRKKLRRNSPDYNESLDYEKFLGVVNSLATLMQALRGRIVRPRAFDAVFYEWDKDNNSAPNIRDMNVVPDWSDGKEPHWAKMQGSGSDWIESPIMSAIAPKYKDKVFRALQKLPESEMETLQSRILLSDFYSDLSEVTHSLTKRSNAQKFTSTIDEIIEYRERGCKFDLKNKTQKKNLELLKDKLREQCAELNVNGNSVHLVNYQRLLENPNSVNEAEQAVLEKFAKDFPFTIAFQKFWKSIEKEMEEVQLNRKVNGWYMANSSFGMLNQASLNYGLKVPITSWAVPMIMTNSVGFIPERDAYLADFRSAITNEVSALLSHKVFA